MVLKQVMATSPLLLDATLTRGITLMTIMELTMTGTRRRSWFMGPVGPGQVRPWQVWSPLYWQWWLLGYCDHSLVKVVILSQQTL